MAFFTGNKFLTCFEKLAAVNVLVASGAVLGQWLHPDLLAHPIHLNIVAFQAEDFAVFSIQSKLSQRVIEGGLMPGPGLVTIGAAAAFHP